MFNPLISICLPNYNYEKFIGETIESVLAQTYDNFELVIVDNGSTDKSVEIIKSYKDERIRLYQNEVNIPVYENINKAQTLARGELIAILHSDDKYEPHFLEKIVESYKNSPEKKVFVSGVYILHHEKNKIIIQHPYKTGGVKPKHEVLLNLLKENNIGNGVNVVYHRECLRTSGLFSDKYRYSADYDLWFRLAKNYDFVYIPEILTYYRIHDSNLSHTVNKNFAMIEEGQNILQNNIKNNNLNEKTYKQILFITETYFLYKYYCMGLKYNSGKFIRELLIYLQKATKFNKFNPVWYYTYLSSYFFNKKFTLLLSRGIFYFYKYYLNRLFENLVNKELNSKAVSNSSI